MSRIVKGGLIQAHNPINDEKAGVEKIQAAMLEKHLPLIDEAGKKGVQILCLQEIFNGPYFCPAQDRPLVRHGRGGPGPDRREARADRQEVQDGRSSCRVYEREMAGVYYNTAAVIDADGKYLGKYRKNHIPQTSGFWEKYYFKPGNLGYPVFQTSTPRSASTSATTATSPKARARSACNGAEIVFNPSATVAGLSQYLWKLEQPAHAVANGYFVGAINRVGTEAPWNIGKFYGHSYFVRPARPDPRRGRPRTRTSWSSPSWTSRHDRGGPQHLAVLPRPPAGELRAPHASSARRLACAR